MDISAAAGPVLATEGASAGVATMEEGWVAVSTILATD